jgi:hypothetical protein
LTTLAKAWIVNYDHNCSFIVLATVIMIVNYDHHLFIVQATDGSTSPKYKLLCFKTTKIFLQREERTSF